MYKSEFTVVNIQTLWLLQHACLMSGRSYNRFDIHSFQSTEYKISTCLFSAKHAALGVIQNLVGSESGVIQSLVGSESGVIQSLVGSESGVIQRLVGSESRVIQRLVGSESRVIQRLIGLESG
jgi:hypothetical protein